MAVHDRFGKTGRAGAVEHPQRVLERKRLERKRPHLAEKALVPPLSAEIGEPDDTRLIGQPCSDLGDRRAAVKVATAVAVAVDRKENLRLDLTEAVDHASGAE